MDSKKNEKFKKKKLKISLTKAENVQGGFLAAWQQLRDLQSR